MENENPVVWHPIVPGDASTYPPKTGRYLFTVVYNKRGIHVSLDYYHKSKYGDQRISPLWTAWAWPPKPFLRKEDSPDDVLGFED